MKGNIKQVGLIAFLMLLITQGVSGAMTTSFASINFTEYQYVLGKMIDLVEAVLVEMPSIIIIIAIVIGISAVAVFIPGLLKKVLDMVKLR